MNDPFKKWIRKKLSKEELWQWGTFSKRAVRTFKEPSKRLVLIVYVTTIVLLALIILEAIHIIVTGEFCPEIFCAITTLIAMLFGTILGVKG